VVEVGVEVEVRAVVEVGVVVGVEVVVGVVVVVEVVVGVEVRVVVTDLVRPIGMSLEMWASLLEVEVAELRADNESLRAISGRAVMPAPDGVLRPGYRSSDRPTSRQGWELNEKTIGTQRGRTLTAFRDNAPYPLTWKDIEAHVQIKGAWKRVSELHQLGFITPYGTQRDGCTVYGLADLSDIDRPTNQIKEEQT